MSKTLIFDIETNGLLLEVDKFWVGVTYCVETKEYDSFRDPYSMVQALEEADLIVGHNIIGYDLPVLTKLTGITITTKCIDTIILAKLMYYDQDKSWSHSLDAYGQRLGFPKGKYSDWLGGYTKEMEDYCVVDVQVTTKLYHHLNRKRTWLPDEALELEQDVQKIVTQQYINGWMFDLPKAQALHIELMKEKEDAEQDLFKVFHPMYLPMGKVSIPKRPFKRLGVETVGPHQKIQLTIFNPGSTKHRYTWINKLYSNKTFPLTEKGTPKTDSATLEEMFSGEDWAKPLLHYLEVNKLLGQLSEGSKSWLNMIKEDGRLHGGADILGAVTGRFTHSNPNLAQVPSVRAYKGPESRSLFRVREGYKLVGCDASGLELRTLSHFLGKYDGGAYGATVLGGDIHTANQQAAGLPTRDDAKTFIYAFLYGAGDTKIGTITGGGAKAGKKLKSTFLRKVVGLQGLITDVQGAAKKGYIRGLSGRRLYIRSPHSALNTLLQSAGAYYMKYFVIDYDKALTEAGIDYKFVGNIHDEVQTEVKESQAAEAAEIAERTFISTGERIGMRIKMEGEAKIGDNWYDTH